MRKMASPRETTEVSHKVQEGWRGGVGKQKSKRVSTNGNSEEGGVIQVRGHEHLRGSFFKHQLIPIIFEHNI